MANKKSKDELTKSYKLKVKNIESDVLLNAIKEQQEYSDRLNKFLIKSMKEGVKIGDLYQFIDNKESLYGQLCLKYATLPLYKIFTKEFPHTNSRDHILFRWIKNINPEKYNNNILGLNETCYRRDGYFKNVVSNYVTKMSSLRPKIKGKHIDQASDENDIRSQVIYEMYKMNLSSVEDFMSKIDYFAEKNNNNLMERFTILCDYFKENEESIRNEYIQLGVDNLLDYEGLKISNRKTMHIEKQNFKIEREDLFDYRLIIPCGKKCLTYQLYGNRQIIGKNDNNEIIEYIDICNKHGNPITFQIDGDDVYVIFTVTDKFVKPKKEMKNIVGCDVNIKHMLLATNIIDDGNVKGYVNIYKALISDDEVCSIMTPAEIEEYKDMAKFVNFCPMESDAIFNRYCCSTKGNLLCSNKLSKIDEAITRVIEKLKVEYKDNVHIYNYLCAVKKLRAMLKAKFVLQMKYEELQSKFDTEQEYKDDSTVSKDTMDKRRFESPFITTMEAQEINTKINNVSRDVIGLRDNIIQYAHDVFISNNYDTVSLENLDSSQFEVNGIPSPKSLMYKHKFLGKSIGEIEMNENKVHFSFDDYEYEVDGDGCTTNIYFSKHGTTRISKNRFYNKLIKNIQFASIKDKFISLSNRGKLNVCLVPSYFSSQMDSKNHTVYYNEVIDKKGKKKPKLVKKHKIRPQQERHINGLNADYNSACNLAYIISNEAMRNVFCRTPKSSNEYNAPLFEASIKSQDKFLVEIKKMGLVELIEA